MSGLFGFLWMASQASLKLQPSNQSQQAPPNITSCEGAPEAWDLLCRVLPGFVITVCFFGLLGNLLVLSFFLLPWRRWWQQRRQRLTIAEIYLANLAASDLVFVLGLPFWAENVGNRFNWPFGSDLCRVVSGVIKANLFISIFLVVAISQDRYRLLVYPMTSWGNRRRRQAQVTCLLIWVAGGLLSTPTFLLRSVKVVPDLNISACILLFPHEAWHFVRMVELNVLGFLLPLAAILYFNAPAGFDPRKNLLCATMERIDGVAVGLCAHSPYLRPFTLHYRQDGVQKSWDFMKTHDSVTILMFNSSRRSLVLVKQFRPAVYAGEVERHFPGSLTAVNQDQPQELQQALPGSAGVMVELCAGIVDQPGLSLEEAACKEAWEECGYRLVPTDLRRVATYMSGVGLTSSRQTMFYAEVTDAQRGGPGGGLAEEGELIEVIHLNLDDAQAFADNPDIPKTLGVIYAISWFFSQVVPHLSLQ